MLQLNEGERLDVTVAFAVIAPVRLSNAGGATESTKRVLLVVPPHVDWPAAS